MQLYKVKYINSHKSGREFFARFLRSSLNATWTKLENLTVSKTFKLTSRQQDRNYKYTKPMSNNDTHYNAVYLCIHTQNLYLYLKLASLGFLK